MTIPTPNWDRVPKRRPINWDLVPEHYRDTIKLYIERGLHPGDFGEALFSNDLLGVMRRADKIILPRLLDVVAFLWRHVPSNCHGSREKFDAWMVRGGLECRRDDDES